MARIGKTNAQKHALRAYYRSATPKLKYDPLQTWFQSQYGERISKSTISDILSSKYLYLDTASFNTDQKRAKDPKWKVLEECLFEWEQRYEAIGGSISGELLRFKATELWEQLPEYEGQGIVILSVF